LNVKVVDASRNQKVKGDALPNNNSAFNQSTWGRKTTASVKYFTVQFNIP
jgi:hypothetical protein